LGNTYLVAKNNELEHRHEPRFMRAGSPQRQSRAALKLSDGDCTASLSMSLAGKQGAGRAIPSAWAVIVSGTPSPPIAYPNAGDFGVQVGDGQLPHPGTEQYHRK
jgi:hypothetical protein